LNEMWHYNYLLKDNVYNTFDDQIVIAVIINLRYEFC
jgi:hypothetical protein